MRSTILGPAALQASLSPQASPAPGAPLTSWTDGLSQASIAVAIAAGLILLAWLLIPLLLAILRRLLHFAGTGLDAHLTGILRPLMRGAAVLVALRLSPQLTRLAIGEDALLERIAPAMDALIFVGWTALLAIAATRISTALLDWYTHEIAHRTEGDVDEQILPFARRVIWVLVVAIAGVTILSRLGVDVSAMVATLGVGSLAIGLAAQSALSDTISGVLIMLDRPFRLGDRIEILEIGTWGDVTDIGLRSTRIRTIDNRQVIVPNSVIAKNLVVNYSEPDALLRIQTEVGLAYGTDVEHARRVLIEAVRGQDWVWPDKPIDALFMAMDDSALTLRVRCWIPKYAEARRSLHALNTCVYDALNEAGIEIPFPQVVLHQSGGDAAEA